MAQTPKSDSPVEATQLLEHFQVRERQFAEHEANLAAARAAFRQERDEAREQIAAAKAEADKLTREARELHREAARTRDNTKSLAVRYARQAKVKLDSIRAHLEKQQSQLDDARGQLSAEVLRFNQDRQEFHALRQDELARQREAWVDLEAQRARLNASRSDAQQHAAKHEAALAARATEVAEREKHLGRMKAKLEADTAGLRQEAAGLEARVEHARTAVQELEQKRDELRAEILTTHAKPDAGVSNGYFVPLERKADRDLVQWTAELDAQDRRLTEEKAALAKLKSALEREAVTITDQRKVLAEQFSMLGAARAEWQEQEGRTVAELEDLARAMRQREDDLAAREERLSLTDSGRRDESGELEQQRKRLDEWQAKFIHVSQLWHSERERREAELADRMRTLASREAALDEMLAKQDYARSSERERMRAELQLWIEDRSRMTIAAAEYDRRGREMLNDLAVHAARAMASEELLAEKTSKNRRFAVLQKRWERAFEKKLQEIDARRAAAREEHRLLEARHDEIVRSLMKPAARPAAPLKLFEELPLAVEEVVEEPGDVLPFAFNRAA